MKDVFRWHSPHVEQEIQLVRWGQYGVPVMLFPTAGGDALPTGRPFRRISLR